MHLQIKKIAFNRAFCCTKCQTRISLGNLLTLCDLQESPCEVVQICLVRWFEHLMRWFLYIVPTLDIDFKKYSWIKRISTMALPDQDCWKNLKIRNRMEMDDSEDWEQWSTRKKIFSESRNKLPSLTKHALSSGINKQSFETYVHRLKKNFVQSQLMIPILFQFHLMFSIQF